MVSKLKDFSKVKINLKIKKKIQTVRGSKFNNCKNKFKKKIQTVRGSKLNNFIQK